MEKSATGPARATTRRRTVSALVVAAACAASCGDGKSAPPADDPHAGMVMPAASDAPAGHGGGQGIPGMSPVVLTADRVQRFGVRTTRVERRATTRSVRTVGIVRTDETRESEVHVKWDGWIEESFVSFVGQRVNKGDPLFSIYSPDLFAAQQELISAARRAAAGTGPASVAMLAAARGKLRHWDVPEETIAAIEASGEIRRAITVHAPRDGTVLTRSAVPGMMVTPAMTLYTIADLTRVWVIADVYEFEAAAVRVGQKARFAPVGSAAIDGEVDFVAPVVDPMTRTVKVRLDVANPGGSLRPGAYGTVTIEISVPEGLVVPADAVIDTGARAIVFVDRGEGIFEPRDVKLGGRVAGQVQVTQGLEVGEAVVTRAQFLLDSESRIRGGPTGPGHSGH